MPDTCPDLTAVAKSENWADAARAVAEMRNIAVHTSKAIRKRLDLVRKHDRAFQEVWKLGLRNLELVLLALFGYSGKWMNRLSSGAWVHEAIEPVPWAKQ